MAVTQATKPQLVTAGAGALTEETFAALRREFAANPANRLAQNAVTRVSIDEVALDHAIATSIDHTVSHHLDDWAVTNQKHSGRCWMFAGLNLFRVGAMQRMGLKQFEFSQNYTLFWDKFERANYFLEAIIETADRDVDDRTVAYLLSRPIDDGGQWNMFVSLVEKHGLVPQVFMPETESSSNTMRLNGILRSTLRQGAKTLRDRHAAGAGVEELRAAKEEILAVVYRVLNIHLGTPPAHFTWQWTDQDKVFHRDEDVTPREFATRYVTLPVDEYVCLVNDPRRTSPYGRTFTVEYLGNVVGGAIVKYLNVEAGLMKELAQRAIVAGEPVWFGCDVGKQMRRDLGIWDKNLYDYGALYQTEFTLDKAARLEYHETLMTHAMLFTGVDIADGAPRRWRVENSWGEENGQKGYYTMNDSWFDEYTFEIAARKSELPAELRRALDQEPIVLPAWDPMGSLAR
ncbi:MAG TPA: C1 family peptidase [Thermomicrobiales bacterium]|nr:C1 family peptidase [Thermomicrobiales bacterium]